MILRVRCQGIQCLAGVLAVVEEAREDEDEIKREPRGGRKHTPGRDHATKTHRRKKDQIGKRLKKKHEAKREKQRIERDKYEQLSPQVKRLLGKPRPPRRK